jgi:hypothetical protein
MVGRQKIAQPTGPQWKMPYVAAHSMAAVERGATPSGGASM